MISVLVATSVFSCAAAYQPYDSLPSVDIMTEVSDTARAGVNVPSTVWNLATQKYVGDFNYSVLVYGNYLLLTNTGTIKAVVSSRITQDPGTNLSSTQNLVLLKKNTIGTTRVAERSVKREGNSTVNFTNLEKNKGIYFVALEKANDNYVLKGTITLTNG